MNKFEKEYRHEITKYLSCNEDEIYFFWKGRVALYALLKAMGIQKGDEVVIQGYTCVVVANAVLYLGAKPIYADIDLNTYNMDLNSLVSKINSKTKVIICQNTYGLSSNLEKLAEIAKNAEYKFKHRVYTLEDCTHGFGGKFHGKPNGTSCDASFFSTQWSKPYTTGIGGFCIVHDLSLKTSMNELEKLKIQPSIKEIVQLKLMYFIRTYIINDFTYWPMIRLYRWLSRHNLVVGSSSGEEVTGIEMPNSFFKDQSTIQFKKGIKSLKQLAKINSVRKKNAEIYTDFLVAKGKNHVNKSLFCDHIFIRYPLLVNNRQKFRDEAEKCKVILGEWFEAPVYPAYSSLELWNVNLKEIPNAIFACEHIVNLPTDDNNVDKVISFLEKHLEYII